MKNENYLERIAIALETLVNQGNSLSAEFDEAIKKETTEETTEEKPVKEETTEETPKYTHSDLKSACLKSARADSANRDKLKALLKTYGAVKAVDVPEDKLAEVIGKIEAGEF